MSETMPCPACGHAVPVCGTTARCPSCGQAMATRSARFESMTTSFAPARMGGDKTPGLAARIPWRVAYLVTTFLLCGGVCTGLLIPAKYAADEPARRMQCANHLTQLGIAMHNYHDVYGAFPPAAELDADGRPLRSWPIGQLNHGINPPVGRAMGSVHRGGANVVLCDGSVRFIRDKVDVETLRQLAHRADGQPLAFPW